MLLHSIKYKMQPNNSNNSNSSNNSDIFNLKTNENGMIISPHAQKYLANEFRTCSKNIFLKRLYKELGDLVDIFEELKWKNFCLAGGLISQLLDSTYTSTSGSDIDVFIFHSDASVLRQSMIEIYDKLTACFTKSYQFIYDNSLVVTILSSDFARSIQLIGVLYNTPLEIISKFDLSHCQVAWDGEKVIYTDVFTESKLTRTTKVMTRNESIKKGNYTLNLPGSIHAYRLVKSYLAGYSIIKPDKNVYIKNYFDQGYTAHIIRRTDKFRFFRDLDMDELLSNEIVNRNLNKNYVPESSENDDQVYENILKYYTKYIKIITDLNDFKNKIIERNSYPGVFK